jgi:hypothetical protein
MCELLGYLLQDCCGGNPDIVKPALDSLHGEKPKSERAAHGDAVRTLIAP